MSTTIVIAIVIAALIGLALIVFAWPRMRAGAHARRLDHRRGEVVDAHREQASVRIARADEAEQIAARERAEAELHETRARLHESGLADDELEIEHERLGEGRFTRAERDAAIVPEERR